MKVGSLLVEYGGSVVVYTGVKLFSCHSNILFLTLGACDKVNQVF